MMKGGRNPLFFEPFLTLLSLQASPKEQALGANTAQCCPLPSHPKDSSHIKSTAEGTHAALDLLCGSYGIASRQSGEI